MKRLLAVICLILSVMSTSAYSAAIINGDFATCDLTGWETTDDLGNSNLADFSVDGIAPDCAATMTIDDPNSSAVFNSLLQPLDFSVAAGNELVMSFDFSVDTLTPNPLDSGFAVFSIFLLDSANPGSNFDLTGQIGEIFSGDILGAQSFASTIALDQSFNNANGWSLEIQLLSSFAFAESSSLTVNSVSLFERAIDVSAPTSISLIFLSLLGMFVYSRKLPLQAS